MDGWILQNKIIQNRVRRNNTRNMIKRFENFDNERKESYDDYLDLYGYPVGDRFIFAPYKTKNGFQIVICPESYWINEECCYDQHIDGILIDMPSGFGEVNECDFEYRGDIKEDISELIVNGFVFNYSFQTYIDNCSESYGKIDIDGLSISEYINNTFTQSSQIN